MSMQDSVDSVAAAQNFFICMQVITVPLLLLSWLCVASHVPSFGWITRPLSSAALPLFELLFLLGTVAIFFGTIFHVVVGGRLLIWSEFDKTIAAMGENAFIGARLLLQRLQRACHASAMCVFHRASGRALHLRTGTCTQPTMIVQLFIGSTACMQLHWTQLPLAAEYFKDIRAHLFSNFDLSYMEAFFLGVLSFSAPFIAYFTLVTFVTATLVQSYRKKNHARIVFQSKHPPPPLPHALWVRLQPGCMLHVPLANRTATCHKAQSAHASYHLSWAAKLTSAFPLIACAHPSHKQCSSMPWQLAHRTRCST